MIDTVERQIQLQDRITELITLIADKCEEAFPNGYKEITHAILIEGKDVFPDNDVINWSYELRRLENEMSQINPWFDLIDLK